MNDVSVKMPELTDQQKFGLLTDREKEVCQLVIDGLSNSEIAETIDVRAQTIKVHLRKIFKKLGINHRIELVRFLKPRTVPTSKMTVFTKDDEMILNLVAAGLTDQEVTETINQNAPDDQKVDVMAVRVVVGRLRRWTGIEKRTNLAIWWLHQRGLIEVAGESKAAAS